MPRAPLSLAGIRESDLAAAAEKIAAALASIDRPVIYLEGPLGAGKTTFVKHLLRQWGLDSSTTVTSPTFTYCNEYQIGPRWIAHLDLYRLQSTSDIPDLISARDYDIFLIEWPDRGNCRELLAADVTIAISIEIDGSRNFVLKYSGA